jgi:hypothetical protein
MKFRRREAFFRGASLGELHVRVVLTFMLLSCHPSDAVEEASSEPLVSNFLYFLFKSNSVYHGLFLFFNFHDN